MKYCGKCRTDVSSDCYDAFLKRGILKVHWECWSACNLKCGFCYRTRDQAIGTDQAKLLIQIIATSGAREICFAGGDPSLRKDLYALVIHARDCGLRVEVQTNGELHSQALLDAIPNVDLLGLSIDGCQEVHERLRNAPGNFDQVLRLMDIASRHGTPFIVRSVVTPENAHDLPALAKLLSDIRGMIRWSLLQFSPVGEGYENAHRYTLTKDRFRETAESARMAYTGTAAIDIYHEEQKTGTYALITASGRLYGTGVPLVNGRYPIVGSLFDEHLEELAALPFSRERHESRYGGLVS